MMTVVRFLLTVLVGLSLLPAGALAQDRGSGSGAGERKQIIIGDKDDERSYYAGINLGLSFLEDARNTPNQQGLFPSDGKSEFDSGASIGGFFGYRASRNLRFDIELGYQSHEFDSLPGNTGAQATAGRPAASHFFFRPIVFIDFPDIGAFTFMVNAYTEFDVGGAVRPFVGAGFGGTYLEVHDAIMLDDSDTVWAAQARAGFLYPVADTVDLSLNYRLLFTGDPRFADQDGNRFKSQYTSHGLEIGVLKRF